jgi:hypothetical protein
VGVVEKIYSQNSKPEQLKEPQLYHGNINFPVLDCVAAIYAVQIALCWLAIRGWGRLSAKESNKPAYCPILSFSQRSGFQCENGAPLFFTCFDYVVLL